MGHGLNIPTNDILSRLFVLFCFGLMYEYSLSLRMCSVGPLCTYMPDVVQMEKCYFRHQWTEIGRLVN